MEELDTDSDEDEDEKETKRKEKYDTEENSSKKIRIWTISTELYDDMIMIKINKHISYYLLYFYLNEKTKLSGKHIGLSPLWFYVVPLFVFSIMNQTNLR